LPLPPPPRPPRSGRRSRSRAAASPASSGPRPQHLTRPEQIEIARLLTARGMGPTDVGLYLGITKGTIRTWRDKGWKIRPLGCPAKAVR
ncbi:hypothetical protein ACFVHW_07910, partial [Streptomyces sp. NPDC127110]